MEFQHRRKGILDNAEKIFAAKGFYDTTMAEIADASGFAIGSLYHFFEGKEHLFTTMMSEKLDMMYADIQESVNGVKGTLNKISALARRQFDFVENNVDFFNLLIRGEGMSLSNKNVVLREKVVANHFRYLTFIEGIMRKGIQEKSLKAMEPRIMACVLLGTIRSITYDWMLAGQKNCLSNMVETVLDIVMVGVKAEVSK